MKLLNKLKQQWKWATHYKVVFVTVERNFTVEHRLFHKPIMTSRKNPDGLRGAKIEMLIFDEIAHQKELDDFELPKTNVVYKDKNR